MTLVACADTAERDVTTPDTVDPETTEADTIPDGIDPAAPAWQRFDIALDDLVTGDIANPFDPAQIDVMVTFEGPDGTTYEMPAFVHQDYSRALVDGRERLTAVGERHWRVRFRPPFGSPEGAWRWRSRAVTAAGESTSEWHTITAVVDDAPTRHGIVRTSARDSRYLVFEDGSPFFAVGENMAWYDARGTAAYDAWLDALAANGGNYIRVWMPSWAFGLEWIKRDGDGVLSSSSLGDYGARLDRAWQLDYVLDRAEALGIQVMLTVLNHGPYSFVHASQWEDNPYNAVNGGPLAKPTDVFTDATARELHRRLLRYIVARWGHSANILAWELWNEVDLVADPASPEVMAWTQEMARELDRLDPYDHLISTSLGGVEVFIALLNDDIDALVERYAFWSMPELDFTQLHFYGLGTTPLDFSADLGRLTRYLHAFGKPALVAEAGVNALGEAETLANDPEGVAFHDILWAGVFAETFGTGMSWWWDNITDPQGYYPQFGPVAELVRGVRFDAEGFVREDGAGTSALGTLTVQVLRGSDTALVWIKNPRHQWSEVDHTSIADANVTLSGLSAGAWRASWIDPYAERATTTEDTTTEGTLSLPVPAFSRDIALRLDRVR